MSDKKVSLSEVNQSIATPKNAGFFRTLLAFSGPGMLVAVGYMDPGNWITSVVGGATYRYLLLSAVLVSSVMAMQFQQLLQSYESLISSKKATRKHQRL